MAKLSAHTSQTTTLAILISFILTVMSSLRARGLKQTLLFVALGLGLPISAEYHAINTTRILRHHLQPQLKGVPVAIGLAWYITGYNTFALIESLLRSEPHTERKKLLLLPLMTALTATSMDLVTDVALLEQGYWEWSINGPYAPEITGPNGKHGIPIANYSGWLLLTSLVTTLFLLLRGKQPSAERYDAGQVSAGRRAALLLLPSYLGTLAWEVRQKRWRYLLVSILFPLALLWALVGRRA